MPIAPQEELRPGLPLLEYGELLDLNRARIYGLSPILYPREIPVHPAVYESPESYTSEFARQVWASVPDSIRADIATIEKKIDHKLRIEVTDQGVHTTGEESSLDLGELFEKFIIKANPSRRSIWVQPHLSAEAIDLGLDVSRPDLRMISMPFENHPMSTKKRKLYEIDPEKYEEEGMITWTAHNASMASFSLLLILRNYAIMHNNLGLQRVGAI